MRVSENEEDISKRRHRAKAIGILPDEKIN
jgi:hypothetical protein